jgi:hypothetical protein
MTTEAPDESWRSKPRGARSVDAENHFLNRLIAAMVGVAVLSWGYNLYSRLSVEPRAQRALDEAALSTPPAREGVALAYSLLRRPHLLGNYAEADAVMPGGDLVLQGLGEDALLAATSPDALAQATAGIERDGQGADALRAVLLERPDSENAAAIAEAFPELALAADLERRGFTRKALAGGAATRCQGYAPCLVGYLEARHPDLLGYLALRRAHAGVGDALAAPLASALVRRPSLTLRAVRLDIVEGKGTPSPSDVALLGSLLELRRFASANGLIFSGYLSAVALTLALIRLLSNRFVPRREPRAAG